MAGWLLTTTLNRFPSLAMPLLAISRMFVPSKAHTISPEIILSDYQTRQQLARPSMIAGALFAKIPPNPSEPPMVSKGTYESISNNTSAFRNNLW